MRPIVNTTFVSLDGVVNHMEKWHFDLVGNESDVLALAQLQAADAMLMGRKTYEVYASSWPGRDGTYADLINAMPKYVASTTLTDPEWHGATVLEGDLVEAVRQLKEQPGGAILQHGFGAVTRTLLAAGLVDELHLWYHPVLAGIGGPDDVLLTDGLNLTLETTGTQVFDNGIVVISLRTRP